MYKIKRGIDNMIKEFCYVNKEYRDYVQSRPSMTWKERFEWWLAFQIFAWIPEVVWRNWAIKKTEYENCETESCTDRDEI